MDKKTYILLREYNKENPNDNVGYDLAAIQTIALALRKFLNESPEAQRSKENDSILWQYAVDIEKSIYNLALQNKIISPTEDYNIRYRLVRCFYVPNAKDEVLLRLCNLLIFLKSKKSVFMDGFGKLTMNEKEYIEETIQQKFFEYLKSSHKIEDYARLITWTSPTPPEELEIEWIQTDNRKNYTYTDNNPQPLSISLKSLEHIKQAEERPFHKKGKEYTVTIYAHQMLMRYGFIKYSKEILTGQAVFIYDVLQYLGYFKNELTVYRRQCDRNKAKRNKIHDIID